VDFKSGNRFEIGRTEQIQNNLSPIWNTKFTLDYRFEERQVLCFTIYDWDNKSQSLSGQQLLGSLECSLGEIVAADGKRVIQQILSPILGSLAISQLHPRIPPPAGKGFSEIVNL